MKLRLAPLLSSSNFHQQPDFILFERLIQVLHHFISLSFRLLRPNAFNYIPAQSSSLIPQLTRHFPLLETTFHKAPTTSITSHLILKQSSRLIKMSGRLDQSLDTIIDGQKKAKREQRRRQGKPGRPAGKVTTAPIGGVKKSTKPVKTAHKVGSTGPAAPQRESTIVVSGLVSDFNSSSNHSQLTLPSRTT